MHTLDTISQIQAVIGTISFNFEEISSLISLDGFILEYNISRYSSIGTCLTLIEIFC